MDDELIEVAGARLAVRAMNPQGEGHPLIFLHEGLGSIELWRDFPARVVDATGHPGLVYSRHGYGWSDPLVGPRQPDYMHREAREVLPVIAGGFTGDAPILIGHSDGASIALIYAGSGHRVAGLVLLAPHVFVEDLGLESIRSLHASSAELVERMAKYHTDPEATLRGWAEVWLDERFRSWNLEGYLARIRCPILLVQCEGDEYGSIAHLDAIESQVQGPVERLVFPGPGHSPHLSNPEPVIAATTRFIGMIGSPEPGAVRNQRT